VRGVEYTRLTLKVMTGLRELITYVSYLYIRWKLEGFNCAHYRNSRLMPSSVVLMDNASIHHTSKAIELIQSVGALAHFIPPYSPDLDPIEELFCKVKACLKENDEAIQAADERAIVDFVRVAFSTVTPDKCYSWFEHAGYIH